jgi:hypothetical protein
MTWRRLGLPPRLRLISSNIAIRDLACLGGLHAETICSRHTQRGEVRWREVLIDTPAEAPRLIQILKVKIWWIRRVFQLWIKGGSGEFWRSECLPSSKHLLPEPGTEDTSHRDWWHTWLEQ